jgi:cytochrome c biogenesis protein CcmG/thiol:disulfide interchange protein DsbE
MTPKRLGLALGVLVAAVVVAVGLTRLPAGSPAPAGAGQVRLTAAQIRTRLAGSAAPLAELHAQAGELLRGGPSAVHARLAELRGHPLVINKWASWCAPCRSEFSSFAHASVNLGGQVAFLGLDSGDTSRADAEAFLRSFPVGYPSYYDHGGQLGTELTDSSFNPVTVFYNRRGSQYIHQGPYPTVAKLEADIKRYALGA